MLRILSKRDVKLSYEFYFSSYQAILRIAKSQDSFERNKPFEI